MQKGKDKSMNNDQKTEEQNIDNNHNIKELIKENNNLKRQLRNLESTLQRNKSMLAARTTINTILESEQKKMERNMNLLLKNSADIILLFDKDGCFTYYTATFIKATGITDADLIGGKHFSGVFARLVSKELADFMQTNFNLALERRGTAVVNAFIDLSGGTGPKYYDIQITPMMDQEGQLEAVMMLFHDITEIVRSQRQAESANLAKSQFLATMSHEIRTPMNAILGIAEIQLQNEALDQATKEALVKIYASGDMLLGIINDILDLSKIEAGKLELVIDNYEIASLISDTAQLNMMRIGSKPIEFELQVDENIPANLSGDELRVKQILNNILSNAFKYTTAGKVKLSITAVQNDGEDSVTLIMSINDTGHGMTKEQVNKLFDEYSRFNMEANRTTEGTGLGMSITQKLISLMSGEIFVESEPGKGSTFTVHIPQGITGSDVLSREMIENLQQFQTSSKAHMRRTQITREPMPYGSVLIVDDVETNIYVARGLLAPYKLKIDAADSGFAAIEKIKRGGIYDVIFMDHMMPQMDGIEAATILRDMGYERPIVALTANAVSGQADIFLRSGFDDFISKPIDIRQMNTVLNKLIRDKQPLEVIEEARRLAKAEKGSPDAEEAGQVAIDPGFAEIFVRDALKTIAALDALSEKETYSDEDMRSYIINIHGMKSALANIGDTKLSASAYILEQAGRNGDTSVIFSKTPVFLNSLKVLVEKLTLGVDSVGGEAADDDKPYLLAKLPAIRAACDTYDRKTAKEVITDLREKKWSQQIKKMLDEIAEHLLHTDFDEIKAIVDRFLEMQGLGNRD